MSAKGTVEGLWQVWQRDGWEAAIRSFIRHDGVWDMSRSGIPDAREFHGPEETVGFFRDWIAPFEAWEARMLGLIEVGDKAVAEWHQTGLVRGAPVEMRFWVVYEERDGQISRGTVFRDRAEAGAAAGEQDLRSLQAPIKARYRDEPGAARITLSARGERAGAPVTCSVDIGRAVYEAQAHEGVGGPGTSACSGDLLLGALAACAQVTCQMVAASMGLEADRIEAHVEGDLDLRGTLGVDRKAAVGFEAIRLRFEVDAPNATGEQLDALLRKTERYCTVMQTLVRPPALLVEMKQTGTTA